LVPVAAICGDTVLPPEKIWVAALKIAPLFLDLEKRVGNAPLASTQDGRYPMV
jgi:hypothetical protein